MKKFSLLLIFISATLISYSQNERIDQIRIELETMVVDYPGLDETIASNVKDVSIVEFLRGVGSDYGINLSVSNKLSSTLTNSFSDARILDVLVLLASQYSLDIEIVGGIIRVNKYIPQPEEIVRIVREPGVEYKSQNDFLSVDLKKDTLSKVVEKIAIVSPYNVILGDGLEDLRVSCFIQNRPFEEVIDKMAFANGLVMRKEGSFFILEKKPKVDRTTRPNIASREEDQKIDSISVKADFIVEDDMISIKAANQSIAQLIRRVSEELYSKYFIYDEPEGEVSIYLENASYEEFLTYVLRGSKFSFIKKNGIYLIGTKDTYNLKTTELIQLQNRTVENVLSSNRSNLSNFGGGGGNTNSNNNNQNNGGSSFGRNSLSGSNFNSKLFSDDLDVQPFLELNSFIVTGSFPEVEAFKEFIQKIDQVVPVVVIDVIIVDVNKSRTLSAGIQAGVGENPGESGQILGGADNNGLNVSLGTEDINALINSFNGLGLVNLGNVTPDFYMNLQALETDGVLRSKDNVRLATLNSYAANINVGSEEYYLETSTNVTASAGNNLVTEQQNWIALQADLSVQIVPIVSGDEQITLQIVVSQSSFTERAGGDNGPFGTVNREFNSNIRVKNGDMILLGGIEDKTVTNSGGGLPFISRIPVLRWIFGNRTKTKSKSQLNIFIKPSIMY